MFTIHIDLGVFAVSYIHMLNYAGLPAAKEQ